MVQEVPPGVPGPFSVYLVFSLPKPDRSFFTRPSVCAPACHISHPSSPDVVGAEVSTNVLLRPYRLDHALQKLCPDASLLMAIQRGMSSFAVCLSGTPQD